MPAWVASLVITHNRHDRQWVVTATEPFRKLHPESATKLELNDEFDDCRAADMSYDVEMLAHAGDPSARTLLIDGRESHLKLLMLNRCVAVYHEAYHAGILGRVYY